MRIDSAIITGSFSVNGDTFNDLGSYSTTGSNAFTGSQNITGSLVVSGSFNLTESASAFQIQGNGFGQTYLQSPNGAIVLNPGYGGVEITGVNNRFNVTDGYITNLYASNGVVSGSSQIVDILSPLNSFTSSTITKINSLEEKTGSLATTGSNTFFGTQTFSGSVYVKENLIVQGSSSLQNITASAVDIGTNKIILNVNNPSVRYAGISVYDSGSTAGTGSLFWDSVENHWLYEHPSDSAAPYNSAILISGPKNAGNLGEELELVSNYIVKAVGGDHISSSAIYDDGTTIALKSNTEISGTFKHNASTASFAGVVGIGRTAPEFTLDVNGDIALNRTNKLMFAGGVVGDRARSYITGNDNNSIFIYNPSNYPIATFKYTGDVGIGITDPAYTFDVNGILHVSKSFADTSNLQIISEGNIAGINLRSSQGGRFSIAQSYISANITSFLTSTGTNNPSVEAIRITNSNGAISVANNISVNSGNEIRFFRSDNAIYTRLYDAGSLGANGFVLDNTNGEGFHFKNNGTTIMRMPSGGNVGIGTTNPMVKLNVNGNAQFGSTTLQTSGTDYVFVGQNSSTGPDDGNCLGLYVSHAAASASPQAKFTYQFRQNDNSGANLYGDVIRATKEAGSNSTYSTFYTNSTIGAGTERMRIMSSGNIGIGTTNSAHKLWIQGNTTFSGYGFIRTYFNQHTTLNSQFDIFRFLNESGGLIAQSGISGILFVNAQDTNTGGNQISYTFHIQTNGNGTAQANITQMSYQLRGTQPIQSVGLQNDGSGGGVKVVASTVPSGVGGANVWVTFMGTAL
jgi:hypothetical protein